MTADRPNNFNSSECLASSSRQALLADLYAVDLQTLGKSATSPRTSDRPRDNLSDMLKQSQCLLDFTHFPEPAIDSAKVDTPSNEKGPRSYEKNVEMKMIPRLNEAAQSMPAFAGERDLDQEQWEHIEHGINEENQHLVERIFRNDKSLQQAALRYLEDMEGIRPYTSAQDRAADIEAIENSELSNTSRSPGILTVLDNCAAMFSRKEARRRQKEHKRNSHDE